MKQVRVIHTTSQNFLESNIPSILAIILNTSPENIFGQVYFPTEGGFVYLRDRNITKKPTSITLKDKESTRKGLDNFFSDKNKRIKEYFSGQKGDGLQTPFFPTQYLDLVVASPHFEKIRNQARLISWSVLYKLKIPPFGANESGRTKYVSSANADLLIKIRVDGVIEEIRYNFLPLEKYQYLILSDPTESENETEISDLTYIFNKDMRVIAPFWLSLTEQPFVPATKTSILPESLNGFSNNKNSTEFNENRVVVWLSETDSGKPLKVKDATSKGTLRKKVKLPPGAKLIRLKPKNANNINTPCLYWWNGKYHLSEFNETSLVSNNLFINDYSVKIFVNDIQHTLDRASVYHGQDIEFNDLINYVKSYEKIIYSKSFNILDANLLVNNRLSLNLLDKPNSIQRILDEIFAIYNPVNNGIKFSDETLVIPLTIKWFEGDKKLLTRYTKVWSENGFPLTGESGEGISDKEFIDIFLDELINLRNIVVDSSQKFTPEALWLENLDVEYLLSGKIKRIISIFDLTWEQDFNDKYSSSIALELSYGIFRIPPLMTVLIHEFVVNSASFGNVIIPHSTRDTHIGVENTFQAWEEIAENGISVVNDPSKINDLYQSHSLHSIIALAVILNIIK